MKIYDFISTFKAVRRTSTPLVLIETADPASSMGIIGQIVDEWNTNKEEKEQAPIFSWDIIRCCTGVNAAAQRWAKEVKNPPSYLNMTPMELDSIGNPVELMAAVVKFPKNSLIFMHNIQLFWSEQNGAVIQAIWNLRDIFKLDGRTLVMLSDEGARLPKEIEHDVLKMDEPLPDASSLSAMVNTLYTSGGMDAPTAEIVGQAVDALMGLGMFTAEQAAALSLKRSGLQIDKLWDRKIQMIEQTPGLSVHRGGESLEDVGGLENIKNYLAKLMTGKRAPNVVLFIDEIEKAIGSSQDTSGTSQEMMGTQLSYMEDSDVTGILALGPPGSGKSLMAKVAASLGNALVVKFDLSGMKDSYVGSSGKNLRKALKMVDAIGNGKVMCIATCNSIAALPVELRRRFNFGTFFFDLPTKEERDAIWKIFFKKYEMPLASLVRNKPEDDGWTGAEIRNCCKVSDALGVSLKDAAQYIVPVSKSAGPQIQALRESASGRYISASHPGVFTCEISEQPEMATVVAMQVPVPKDKPGTRKIDPDALSRLS